MIELIATGPVESVEDERIRKTDGHDSIHGTVSITRRTEAEIDLEFSQGHVNLEGYAPSVYGDRAMPLGSVQYHIPEGFEPIADEWDVRLAGEWFDWVQQAHRYQTERPDRSLVGHLTLFSRWDETDGRSIDRALEEVEHIPLSGKAPADMNDGEWDRLRRELNTLENVSIPESYSE